MECVVGGQPTAAVVNLFLSPPLSSPQPISPLLSLPVQENDLPGDLRQQLRAA